MTSFDYDVFVSYRQADPDRRWVQQRLVPRLQAEGLSVCTDYLSFRLGAPLVREMERAVLSSRYTLAVLSSSYLSTGFTDLEAVLARHLSLERRERRLLAVRIDPDFDPPLEFRAHLWLEMCDDDAFEPAVRRLVPELRRDPGE